MSRQSGMQPKYRDGDLWLKEDVVGGEAYAEVITSTILDHSNITHPFVRYSLVSPSVCSSLDFTHGSREVTLEDMLSSAGVLQEYRTSDDSSRLSLCLDLFQMYGLTYNKSIQYLQVLATVDFIFCNPDRHEGNLGVLVHPSGAVHPLPIFDMGLSLGVFPESPAQPSQFWDVFSSAAPVTDPYRMTVPGLSVFSLPPLSALRVPPSFQAYASYAVSLLV